MLMLCNPACRLKAPTTLHTGEKNYALDRPTDFDDKLVAGKICDALTLSIRRAYKLTAKKERGVIKLNFHSGEVLFSHTDLHAEELQIQTGKMTVQTNAARFAIFDDEIPLLAVKSGAVQLTLSSNPRKHQMLYANQIWQRGEIITDQNKVDQIAANF